MSNLWANHDADRQRHSAKSAFYWSSSLEICLSLGDSFASRTAEDADLPEKAARQD
jgi:hypothetical protein